VVVTRTLPAGPPYLNPIDAHLVSIGAGAARTLGLRSAHGSRIEDIGAPGKVFVNQAMADLLGGDAASLGQYVTQFGLGAPVRIAGVVENVHETNIFAVPIPTVYYPFAEFGVSDADLVVRLRRGLSASDASAVIGRAAASSMAGIVVSPARSMPAMIADASSVTRFTALFLMWLGLGGLLTVALGAWGEAAAMVRRNSHDLAVRLALGAAPARLAGRMVLSHAAAGLGAVAAGAAAAWGFSRVIGFLYHGFQPGAAGFLLGAAGVEIYVVIISGGALLRGLRQDPRTLLNRGAQESG
ncbi:MAG: hypothetical protein ACRD1E_07680, partial [Terriglobales bacterium]